MKKDFWQSGARRLMQVGILIVAALFGLLMWRGYRIDHVPGAIKMGLGYLPYMFATFGAIVAGYAAIATEADSRDERDAKVCYMFGGFQLLLGAIAQAAYQLNDMKDGWFIVAVALAVLLRRPNKMTS